MIKIALIGAGSIGRVHAANIRASDRATLHVVCDINADAAATLAAPAGAGVAATADEAFASGPDAVIIASSTASHGSVADACVRARLPFLCEKPLASDPETAERIASAADAAGVVSAMGFNRRFDHQYAAIREAVRAGDIGRPEAIVITSRSERPPTPEFITTSGGLFGEKGSHFYDLCRWICGEDPVEVFAMGSVLIDEGFRAVGEVDTALVSLRMASGTLCQLDFSWRAAYGQDERLEVNGSKAMLQTRQAPCGDYLRQSGQGLTHPGPLPSWRERFASTYRDELSAFLDLVEGRKGETSLARLNDGVASQRIARAAQRACADKRLVVI